MSIETWPIDGKDHHDISESGLYHNNRIDSFLHGEQRTLIIAAKGMGKTLLLRAKKNQLEQASEGHLIIPRNQEYDYPEIRGSLAAKGLEEMELWKDIWTASFIFSALSHRGRLLQDQPEEDAVFVNFIEALDTTKNFKEILIHDFREKSSHVPSHYLNLILGLGFRGIRKFIRTAFTVDTLSNRYINSSTCIFIDAFDQTLTEKFSNNLKIWKNAQIGLIYAAHRIKNANKHIKVFASIRQEAWAAFRSDDREVMKGQSVILEYSKLELRQMFLHAISKYSPYQGITDFLGLESIQNGWVNVEEDPFDYIYRHSVSSPRSIMSLGNVLHGADLNQLDPVSRYEQFRYVVNKNGAEHLYKDYLISQRKIFLHTLGSEKRIKELLRMIPSNVLPERILETIRRKYSRKLLIDEDSTHPFCELFNVGVLGFVKLDPVTHRKVQFFKQPQDFDWQQQKLIRENGLYLVHPSLHESILEERGDNYYLNPTNIIGDGRPWNQGQTKVFPLVFISHASSDKHLVEPVISQLGEKLDQTMPCDFWYDKNAIPHGGHIHSTIENGITESDLVLVFVSENSMASGWVQQEWRSKHDEEVSSGEIRVICCMLDDTPIEQLPPFFREKKIVYLNDMPMNRKREIEKLAANLETYLRKFWEPAYIEEEVVT